VRATLSEGDCETLCRGVDPFLSWAVAFGAVLDEELCEVNISRTRLRQADAAESAHPYPGLSHWHRAR